jgi:hypothetical protein
MSQQFAAIKRGFSIFPMAQNGDANFYFRVMCAEFWKSILLEHMTAQTVFGI